MLAGSPAIDKGNPAQPGSGGNACEASDQRLYGRAVDGDGNGSARCDVGAYEVGAAPVTIITYTYDPLYRLTGATYTTGPAFYYAYDAVGNRLTQTTITNTTVYTYDIANRLVNVGGVAQTWDSNGNLLNDGVFTYTYDSANRLASAVQGANTYTFGYNGLADRMRQVANGITTTYTLDLNAGLTQVLADGTNTYLHGVGNGRIAQYAGTTPAYFLGDALGSVRQLANASGAVTLARSYDPYGNALTSAGSGTTNYNFAGEWRDNTGLLHLRARYYGSYLNQWIQPDPIIGQFTNPQTLNRYSYVTNNPINLTDPSGTVPCSMLPLDDQIDKGCIPNAVGNSPSGPDITNYDPTRPPAGITWEPSMDVGLASQVPKGVYEAQYFVYDNGGLSSRAEYGYNLCGQIALSMILEYETGTTDRLLDVWRATGQTRDLTGGEELFPAVSAVFPHGQGWQGAYYSYRQVLRVHVDSNRQWYESLDTNWWVVGKSNQFAEKLRAKLRLGHYLIPGVRIDTSQKANGSIVPAGSPHWVLLTGFSAQWRSNDEFSPWNWVRINNPFGNRTEYYWWGDFRPSTNTAGFFLIELWKRRNPSSWGSRE